MSAENFASAIVEISALGFIQGLDLSGAAAEAGGNFDPRVEPDRYNLVWNSPGRDTSGSTPIGNGEVGLDGWVETIGDLVFHIFRPDACIECIRLLKLGRERVKLSPKPFVNEALFRQESKLRGVRLKSPNGRLEQLTVTSEARRPDVQIMEDSND